MKISLKVLKKMQQYSELNSNPFIKKNQHSQNAYKSKRNETMHKEQTNTDIN